MKTEIVPIGNSKGVRIPKALLEECGLNGTVNLRAEKGRLIIERPRKPREGWEESIKRSIAKHGMPEMLWPDDMHDEFDADWEWPEELKEK